MTFLQPLMLFALPAIALPVLIHLINQNRYRSIPWAATMFLLQAKRMARGMARLRYFLIMAARMLAIAGLIFALSRPMAGGWLGLLSGGAPDVTIILLDRSASMEEEDLRTGRSKRQTAVDKISQVFQDLGRNTRAVLFDSATGQRFELDSAIALSELPDTGSTSTSADLAALMQDAVEYIASNDIGRADIWICSDLRLSDWNPGDGRWESVRSQLADRSGVRLYLLTYQHPAEENLSVSVSGIHRRETIDGAELVMDLQISRATPVDGSVRFPVTFEISGARSTTELELTGSQLIRNGHAIPIDREMKSGWGRVELPRDANAADNTFHFVFAEPAIQRTMIVSDDPETAELLRLAAATPSDRSLTYEAKVVSKSETAEIDWDATALVIWQAPLPSDVMARQLETFARRGGGILFFPSESTGSGPLFGTSWGEWREPAETDHFSISRWRTDTDLLGNSRSGQPLPVGQLAVYRSREILNDTGTILAQQHQGPPLLVRVPTDGGAVWFCSTLPASAYSSLVSNGVSYYVMIQRAIARGAASLGFARHYDCGTLQAADAEQWKPLDDLSRSVLISQRTLHAGLYQSGSVSLALNRPLSEDNPETLTSGAIEQIFSGLNYTRIEDQAGSSTALASEVWRIFLILMIAALIIEAVLCLPDRLPSKASH